MKKVLLLAYHYPPLGGVAVMRVLRFSRYLAKFGWEATVLCVEGGSKNEPRDETLLGEIPDNIAIERVGCIEPDNFADTWEIPKEKIVRNLFKTFDRVLFPDDRALWVKPVTRRAISLIKSKKIDVIWATAQPWSTLVAARNIKRATKTPLVLDFRDDWTTSNADFRKTKKLQREQELEQSVLKEADAVISVTPHIVEQLQARAPENLRNQDFHYIPNGFDPAHFEVDRRPNTDTFDIVHTGGLYHLRPIEPFLAVLDHWFTSHPARRDQIKVKLAGKITGENRNAIEASPWKSCIEILGFVDHATVRELITTSAVNLLMIEQVKTAPWLFTGKVFEYIGARRPILMLGPNPSPLATLLSSTGLGHISAYQDPQETAEVLERLYKGHERNETTCDDSQIELYNAENQTADLVKILEEVSANGQN